MGQGRHLLKLSIHYQERSRNVKVTTCNYGLLNKPLYIFYPNFILIGFLSNSWFLPRRRKSRGIKASLFMTSLLPSPSLSWKSLFHVLGDILAGSSPDALPWLIGSIGNWWRWRWDLELEPSGHFHFPLPKLPTFALDTQSTWSVQDFHHH